MPPKQEGSRKPWLNWKGSKSICKDQLKYPKWYFFLFCCCCSFRLRLWYYKWSLCYGERTGRHHWSRSSGTSQWSTKLPDCIRWALIAAQLIWLLNEIVTWQLHVFQYYQCSLNIEKLTFSLSLSGLNSMTKGNSQIDVGMYGTALYPLIDYSINFRCHVSNYSHLWILLPVESNAGYFIDRFHNSNQI